MLVTHHIDSQGRNNIKKLHFYMEFHAFPFNIKQIKGFAWTIFLRSGCEKQFKEEGPTEKWWRGLRK